MSSPPPARSTSSQGPPSSPTPPSPPAVTATFASAVIEANAGYPPEFIVTAKDRPMLALEFATDPRFDDSPRPSVDAPLRYFNTYTGLNEIGDAGLKVAGQTLQPGRGGIEPESGPAGTDRMRYTLDPRVWDEFVNNVGPNRLYYRVFSFTKPDRRGKPAGDLLYSWKGVTLAQAEPPFIIIKRDEPSNRDLYAPPALMPSIMAQATGSLRLDAQGRLVKGERTVSTDAFTLSGVNLSGLQHRQFNWPQPFADTMPASCAKPVNPGPKDPPLATHCPLPANGFLEALGFDRDLFRQLKSIKCSAVRITFNQDWVLNGLTPAKSEQAPARPGEQYLRELDQLIAWAGEEDIYVILAMHTLRAIRHDNGRFDRIYEAHLPDAQSITCWRVLSERYRDVPSLLFDLCNEPHQVDNDKDKPCYIGFVPDSRAGWVELWHDWVRVLEEGLHDKQMGREDRLIVVSGMYGAGRSASLRDMPVRKVKKYRGAAKSVDPQAGNTPEYGDPLPNVVYASHPYCDECEDGLPGDAIDHWLAVGADLKPPLTTTTVFPVLLAEWGPAKDAMEANGKWVTGRSVGMQCAKRQSGDHKARITALEQLLRMGSLNSSAYLVGWVAWAVGDKPYMDLEELTDIRCCGGDLSNKVEHRFAKVTTAPSGATHRALTDWGEIVVKSLKRP